MDHTHHEMPFTRIELCVFGIRDGELHVLLARREERPQQGMWALPGGVLRIDMDKDLDDAARRVGRERLRAPMPYLRQQCAEGGLGRDDRVKWALSIVYRVLVDVSMFAPEPGKRVTDLKWEPVRLAAKDKNLAFDHAFIVSEAVIALRREVAALDLPFAFLPSQFTLTEVQQVCEAISGAPMDKSSFRRRLDDREIVEAIPGQFRPGPNRPAQLFRSRSK
jgi:ADP-ribose pyrophosphatase YjhB (NUDIX family)